MNQKEIVEVLEEKFLDKQSNYRIGLNGKWGIGKSFAWELLKEKISKENNENGLNIIYCSLFGIDTVEALKKELKRKKLEHNEHIGKITKKSNSMYIKATGMITKIASNKFLGSTVDLFELISLDFEDDYLICFDDLERTNISITDVMGVIEQVAQSSKVLVIYNEIEMNDKIEAFTTQKEKILEIEYTLDAISPEIISLIIDKPGNTFAFEEKVALTKFFSIHGNNNLRTLNKLTRFISELKRKIIINAELVNIFSAVFLEEILKKDTHKISDEEKSKLELNPLLIYGKYNIHYRAFTLVDYTKDYIVTNKLNKLVFEEYINPREKSQIVLLIDRFYDAIVGNEQSIKATIEESIEFLNKSEPNQITIEYLVNLVGELKFYNSLFKLNLVPENIDAIVLNKIKGLIVGYYKNDDIINKKHFSFFRRISGRSEVTILVQQAKHYEQQIIQQSIINNFKNNFDKENYNECEIIVNTNSDILSNVLYIFDNLSKPCTQDYFQFIRTILEYTQMKSDDKKLVRRRLFNLKRTQKDIIANYRIRLALIGFLNSAYNKKLTE